MAVGAVGLFSQRLLVVVRHSAVLQAGYVALGLSASLLTGESAGISAAVFQAIAAAAAVSLMWIAASVISRQAGESLPLPEGAAPPAWCVFCLTLSCMSLVGLPPLVGLPAKVAIIQAGLPGPDALLLVTLAAAALGAVSLWAYAGFILPMITGRISQERRVVAAGLRLAVDALIAIIIGLGIAPYIGFAIGAALAGGR
jgi:formate hydrogenlyase subunit 3/multisubunit Na+/H+ antiporter MnhD subunit